MLRDFSKCVQDAGIFSGLLMIWCLAALVAAVPQEEAVPLSSYGTVEDQSSTTSGQFRQFLEEGSTIDQSSSTSSPFQEEAAATTDPPEDLANFGDTIQINGAMERTDQDFKDGFALDLFSPKNRSLVVTQNNSPLNGSFVKGTTGEPFTALSSYSYVLKMNETANDLVAKVELPYDPDMLRQIGIDQANLYVGTLSQDKQSWTISETQRNVHVSENKTRIIKMTSLDGEYILLGRGTQDTSNIFVQYGQGATRTVNITGGSGVREAEFVDGLRFSIKSEGSFKLNTDFKNGVESSSLPSGFQSLNSYAWVVNTTQETSGTYIASVRFPGENQNPQSLVPEANETGAVNKDMLKEMTSESQSLDAVSVGRRDVNSSSPYTVLNNLDRDGDSIHADLTSPLDGEYALLVSTGEKGVPAAAAVQAISGASTCIPRLATILVTVAISVLAF